MSAAWVRPFRLTPMPHLRLACFPMQAAAPASSVAGANACRQTSTCLPAVPGSRGPLQRGAGHPPGGPRRRRRPRPARFRRRAPGAVRPQSRRGAGLRNRPAPGKRRRAAAPPVRLRPSGTAPATRRRVAPRRRGGAAGGRPPPGWRQRATRGRRPARAVPADPARRLPGDRDLPTGAAHRPGLRPRRPPRRARRGSRRRGAGLERRQPAPPGCGAFLAATST